MVKWGEVRWSEEVRCGKVGWGEVRGGEVRCGKVGWGEVRWSEVREGEVRRWGKGKVRWCEVKESDFWAIRNVSSVPLSGPVSTSRKCSSRFGPTSKTSMNYLYQAWCGLTTCQTLYYRWWRTHSPLGQVKMIVIATIRCVCNIIMKWIYVLVITVLVISLWRTHPQVWTVGVMCDEHVLWCSNHWTTWAEILEQRLHMCTTCNLLMTSEML